MANLAMFGLGSVGNVTDLVGHPRLKHSGRGYSGIAW
jgi:hypothetical protein